MTRRRRRDEPAATLIWRGLSPITRLVWSVAGLVTALLLLLLWPPKSLFGALYLVTLAVASATGAVRALVDRRRARQGSDGPAPAGQQRPQADLT